MTPPESALEGLPVLVTGASGFVGGHLVGDLLARGARVTAMVRREADAQRFAERGVEARLADLRDRASLDAAVIGQRAVVHCAGAADVSDAAINQAVNVDGTARLAEACAALEQPARVVLFSSHCAVRPLQDAYGRTKLESEQALRATGAPHVILRPTMIYGEGSGEFTTFVRVVRRLPVVPIIGSGRSTIMPVFLDDLLPAVASALVRQAPLGQAYEICGPEPISFDALVAEVARHQGARRRPLHVPGWLALLGARMIGMVWRHPPITVDQVMGFLQDTVADPGPAMRDLAFAPRPPAAGLSLLFTRTPVAVW